MSQQVSNQIRAILFGMARELARGIREKRPGYFEVRVYGGVDPLTGKTLQMSRSVRGTVKDANELRARLMVEVARRGAGTDRTVLHLFETVLDHLETLGGEQTTLVDYRQIAGRFDEVVGGLPLRKLRVTHLDAFYAELIRSGLTAARVRRYHSFVHRCLAQAVRQWASSTAATFSGLSTHLRVEPSTVGRRSRRNCCPCLMCGNQEGATSDPAGWRVRSGDGDVR